MQNNHMQYSCGPVVNEHGYVQHIFYTIHMLAVKNDMFSDLKTPKK